VAPGRRHVLQTEQPARHLTSTANRRHARNVKGERIPIACTLDGPSTATRVEEWRAVLSHVHKRNRHDGGVRLEFGPDAPVDEVARLMAAEQDCCRFFAFALTVDSRGVGLEVSAPEDGIGVVEALFGAAP
jgi:MerR family copper efflux transcriptional regulator